MYLATFSLTYTWAGADWICACFRAPTDLPDCLLTTPLGTTPPSPVTPSVHLLSPLSTLPLPPPLYYTAPYYFVSPFLSRPEGLTSD